MKAKCIMIQGTASSVGKSLITAGLCRIFKLDGYRVSPFKSQNMALNSFITKEGKEMGRAQVVQAEAAGLEPSVLMNPVLLKPTTDKKAQVIVKGEVYANMSAVEYHEFKTKLVPMVKEAYDELASKNDIIVIEGAGSPAEINLRENDIVNMGMADIADSPVILVGDIDKGGVFASLAGTMLLLTESEKARVKGVIINKFRGDIEILKPGIKMLEDIIKVPVLGVIPYTRLNIEDEDSLAERFNQQSNKNKIDIAVIKLPHISNFTDFAAIENIEDVGVRYIDQGEQLKGPDLIILPGSKNTIEDLMYIRKSGLEEQIIRLNKSGTPVFGICGGYQMLGYEISDPFHTESSIEKIAGMGLLDVKTVFQKEKTTTQVSAELMGGKGLFQDLVNISVAGYEIHMGTSEIGEGCTPFIIIRNSNGQETNRIDGVMNEKGTVFGSYIHGIFDNMEFTLGIINRLRKNKGFEDIENKYFDFSTFKETQYNELANVLRASLDIEKIYDITIGRN